MLTKLLRITLIINENVSVWYVIERFVRNFFWLVCAVVGLRVKESAPFAHTFLHFGRFVVEFLEEGPKLQIFVNRAQGLLVGFGGAQGVEVEVDWHVGLDSDQEFRKTDLLFVLFHLALDGSLELVGAVEQIVNRAKLGDELDGGFFAYAGAARHIVGGVAHEAEQVNHLVGVADAVFLADFIGAEFLHG